MDLLMCVGPDDIDYLFRHALKLCRQNLEFCKTIHLVSPDPDRVADAVRDVEPTCSNIQFWRDDAVLTDDEATLPGWIRQQLIKLRADRFCSGPHICCLGADTLMLKTVRQFDLFHNNEPVLYYNRYTHPNRHLDYERDRVLSIAGLLGVQPRISHLLGDFIMDFTVFKSSYLAALRGYLESRVGRSPFVHAAPRRAASLEEKQKFGEWTLYAVFVLDVLRAQIPVRNSRGRFLAQVHSWRDLAELPVRDCTIVHVVPKRLEVEAVVARLRGQGIRL
jgi:hypothetical protein